MAEAESLSFAFLRAHPGEAAQVLESQPPAEVAALLERAPLRLGAPVLAAMLPAAAARTLDALEDERAMAILGALGAQPAAALLRHVGEPRRSRLIAGLPATVALASRLLLGYAEASVGAWADPEVVVLSPATRAAEALARVRAGVAGGEVVFVAGAGGRLQGQVALPDLLRAGESATLETLMVRAEAVLAAHTPLSRAAEHPGWRTASALPVVEANDRLLGVLSRAALARALERPARNVAAEADDSLAGMMARSYWQSLAAVIEASVGLLPRTRPVIAAVPAEAAKGKTR